MKRIRGRNLAIAVTFFANATCVNSSAFAAQSPSLRPSAIIAFLNDCVAALSSPQKLTGSTLNGKLTNLLRTLYPEDSIEQIEQRRLKAIEKKIDGLTPDQIVDKIFDSRNLASIPYYLATHQLRMETLLSAWKNDVLLNQIRLIDLIFGFLPYLTLLSRDDYEYYIQKSITVVLSRPNQFFELMRSLPRSEDRIYAYNFIAQGFVHRPFNERSYLDLALLSTTPFDQIPNKIRDSFRQDWAVDIGRFGAVHSHSIIHTRSDQCMRTGTCPQMWKTFSSTTLSADDGAGFFESQDPQNRNFKGRGIVVYLDHQPIGIVKLIGDASFLALQNVFDAAGKMVLVAGGVYWTNKSFYFHNVEPSRADGEAPSTLPQWYSVNVNQLNLLPQTFLLNSRAVNFNLSPSHFVPNGNLILSALPPQDLRQVWDQVVQSIHQIRKGLTVEPEF